MHEAVPVHDPVVPTEKSLLRFITCGSVDDGKSTLLGRLLWETNAVFEDQAEALQRDSRRFGTNGEAPDFALLVDGLAAEREQGITIDVAHRYFATPRRAFIAADTPGHEQYTRNMATGASTADVAVILVDARKGILPQTRRHSYIVSMLGVRNVIVAVNKMDLVAYSEVVFHRIEADYRALLPALGFAKVHMLPLSAREGDNIATPSVKTPWYRGENLLHLLETMTVPGGEDAKFRLPVQWVNRPHADFRGFSGTIASGEIRAGDPITVLPRGQSSRIGTILLPGGEAGSAREGQAVTLTLADEIDCSRGDVIVATASAGRGTRHLTARLLTLGETPAEVGKAYLVKLGTAMTGARIEAFEHAVDVHDYATRPAGNLPMNGIGLTRLYFETPLYASRYADCHVTGALLLIDPLTHATVALGVIESLGAEASGNALREELPLLGHMGRAFSGIGALPPGASQADTLCYSAWRLWSGGLVGILAGLFAHSFLIGALVALADILLRPILRGAHDRLFSRWQAARARREQEKLSVDGGGI